jgi:hypothetical protein
MSEPLAGSAGLIDRLRPGTVDLHDLGAMNQALSGERHQVRLFRPPGRQRGRPLVRTPQIGDLQAGVNHRAVDIARYRLPDLAGEHRDHGLIKQG